jgi:ABC-2 type transport system permease protein
MIRRVRALVSKELFEIVGNRTTLMTLVVAPVIMLILALVNLYTTTHLPESPPNRHQELPAYMSANCDGLGELECVQAYVGSTFQLVFLLLPLVIPSAIAAYSVVGEKSARTLEPVLATPVTTAELLFSKIAASIAPGIAVTWAAWGAWMIGAFAMASPKVFAAMFAPEWLFAMIVLGPLLALGATSATVMISSRVTDPRTAQQLSALVVIPMIGAMFAQITGVILISPTVLGAACLGLAALDAGLLWLAVATFERESILTRWK